ncbi:hypothetical protein ACFW04_002253 [Cataglyphis niger]
MLSADFVDSIFKEFPTTRSPRGVRDEQWPRTECQALSEDDQWRCRRWTARKLGARIPFFFPLSLSLFLSSPVYFARNNSFEIYRITLANCNKLKSHQKYFTSNECAPNNLYPNVTHFRFDSTAENADFIKLGILAPIATLKMGSTLNPKNIKEGSDVYFECNIRANPKFNKLAWFHEKEQLHHNVTAGVVLSDHSLVLQSITRESAGGYTCMAGNVEGRAKSNIVNLEVLFAPVCKHVLNSGGGWRHQNATPPPINMPEEVHAEEGALKHETISLVCEVEANPTNVTFHWTFNSSGDLSDIPSTKYTNEGTTSRLNYTPLTDMDNGVLGCWASNAVGHSKQPCLYQVIAAGRPYPLQNCTTYNLNGSWVRISCVEGYDGGLPQKFVAIVGKHRLESSSPSWQFQMLKPAKVALYAVNAKGSSEPYAIEVVLKGVAKFTGESTSSVDMSPILIGLGGTATGLGLIVTGVLMALWRRHAATPAKPKPPQQPSIATFAGKGEEEDGNPDLIPTTALTNHLTDRKLPRYGSLPRRPRQLEGREMSHDVLEDSDYPRASPNTFYSLQRPHSESINRSIQESCI